MHYQIKTNMINISEKTKVILKEHGLDFRIEKLPMVGVVGTGKETQYINSEYFGLQNTKTAEIINTVKGSYTVSQNDEIVEMVIRGMKNFGELSVANAGSLNDGRKVFIQLAIDGMSRVGADEIKRYITIIDSNDGSTGLSVGIGDLTMSCQNQFFKFYRAGEMKFRHTATIEEKIKALPQYIENALSESMRMIEVYNTFQSTAVTKKMADDMVKYILGYDRNDNEKSTRAVNAMETLYAHIAKETAQKGMNLWGLHSGVTSWTTHEKSAPRRDNGRIESIMTGTNYKTNMASLEFAVKHSKVSDLVLA